MPEEPLFLVFHESSLELWKGITILCPHKGESVVIRVEHRSEGSKVGPYSQSLVSVSNPHLLDFTNGPRHKKEIGRIELQIMSFENSLQFCNIQFLCNGIGCGGDGRKVVEDLPSLPAFKVYGRECRFCHRNNL